MTPPDPLVGQLFAGRYTILDVLAEGGMGKVYRAQQESPRRLVALKVVRRDLSEGTRAAERFLREMSATSLIEHPHTVRVYDFGRCEHGELFLAMELLDGTTLRQALAAEGAMDPARVVHIGMQSAKALGAAHAKGIVHRDIKPDNIMLTQPYGESDYVKVLDFGLAHFAEAEPGAGQPLTKTGLLLGTPDYMSPEQAEDRELDARSDLYSLGVVLYQLVTNTVPFTATTPIKVLYKHLHEAPRPPSTLAPGPVPSSLELLILKLLSKDPSQRPQTAEAVIDAFGRVARELRIDGRYDTIPEHEPPTVLLGGMAEQVAEAAAKALASPPVQTPEPPVDVETPAAIVPARRRRRVILMVSGAAVVAAVAITLAVVDRPGAGSAAPVSPEQRPGVTAPSRPLQAPRIAKPTPEDPPAPAAPETAPAKIEGPAAVVLSPPPEPPKAEADSPANDAARPEPAPDASSSPPKAETPAPEPKKPAPKKPRRPRSAPDNKPEKASAPVEPKVKPW